MAGTHAPRMAIIDIGSNSVRLVVYQGPPRLPATLFNEKVMAGLGRGLAATGAIDPVALGKAQVALARFASLAREMGVATLRTVATAAVRDAANGGELIACAESLGLEVELLSGEQEAKGAGEGVLSAIPDADGIVGDLGGGAVVAVAELDEAARLGVQLVEAQAKGVVALGQVGVVGDVGVGDEVERAVGEREAVPAELAVVQGDAVAGDLDILRPTGRERPPRRRAC